MRLTPITRIPAPGEIVRVRQRQYLVEEVVRPSTAEDATLVRMSCLDDDAQGQELVEGARSDYPVLGWGIYQGRANQVERKERDRS